MKIDIKTKYDVGDIVYYADGTKDVRECKIIGIELNDKFIASETRDFVRGYIVETAGRRSRHSIREEDLHEKIEDAYRVFADRIVWQFLSGYGEDTGAIANVIEALQDWLKSGNMRRPEPWEHIPTIFEYQ